LLRVSVSIGARVTKFFKIFVALFHLESDKPVINFEKMCKKQSKNAEAIFFGQECAKICKNLQKCAKYLVACCHHLGIARLRIFFSFHGHHFGLTWDLCL
jgi:hypothetical protein